MIDARDLLSRYRRSKHDQVDEETQLLSEEKIMFMLSYVRRIMHVFWRWISSWYSFLDKTIMCLCMASHSSSVSWFMMNLYNRLDRICGYLEYCDMMSYAAKIIALSKKLKASTNRNLSSHFRHNFHGYFGQNFNSANINGKHLYQSTRTNKTPNQQKIWCLNHTISTPIFSTKRSSLCELIGHGSWSADASSFLSQCVNITVLFGLDIKIVLRLMCFLWIYLWIYLLWVLYEWVFARIRGQYTWRVYKLRYLAKVLLFRCYYYTWGESMELRFQEVSSIQSIRLFSWNLTALNAQ